MIQVYNILAIWWCTCKIRRRENSLLCNTATQDLPQNLWTLFLFTSRRRSHVVDSLPIIWLFINCDTVPDYLCHRIRYTSPTFNTRFPYSRDV